MLVCEIYPTNIGQILILFANMCYATQMATLIVAMNGTYPYGGLVLCPLCLPFIATIRVANCVA